MHIKRKVNSSAEQLNHKFLPRAYFYSPCKNRGTDGKSDAALTPAALGVVAKLKMVTEYFLHLLHEALRLKNCMTFTLQATQLLFSLTNYCFNYQCSSAGPHAFSSTATHRPFLWFSCLAQFKPNVTLAKKGVLQLPTTK